MKHIEHFKPADRADLDRAAEMMEGGKALRKRVFARLRARAWRKAKEDNHG